VKTIQVIGVPMDLGAGRRGVDMGPSAIRIAGLAEKLRALGCTVTDAGDITTKIPEQQRVKDEKLRYLPEIARVTTLLAGKVEKVFEVGDFPLILGGDHSIAIGSVGGLALFCRRRKKKLGLLWIDAHGDMNTPETSPTGNIHGMPLAVCAGVGPAELTSIGGHSPKLNPRDIFLIGVRELDSAEKVRIRETGINILTIEDIDKYGVHGVMERTLRRLARNVDYVHVSFDLDVVDPTIAPGVGTPVKGGLSYREAHSIMETIAESKLMTSLDVVEVNPILDNHNQSAELAVELVESAFGKKIL